MALDILRPMGVNTNAIVGGKTLMCDACGLWPASRGLESMHLCRVCHAHAVEIEIQGGNAREVLEGNDE